jgi:hypothetical protein
MNRTILLVLLSILLFAQEVWAQKQTRARMQDPNAPSSAVASGAAGKTVPGADVAQWVFSQAMATSAQTDPNLCAIVALPGPADSFNIRFGLFNVAADRLDFLIMDSFQALKGQSLLHESVFDTVAPPSGTLTVHYPLAVPGKGPVVLGFTDFTQFESAAFNTDPDTYDNPDFGATVLDMDETVIELVYSSNLPDSLRCRGTLKFDPALNTSIANIVQVFAPEVIVYVGYLNNVSGTPNPGDTPTPFDPAPNTRLISTGGVATQHDTGVIRFENRTDGPVTIDRGLRVTTGGGTDACPATPCVVQLWDSVLPITLAPGENLVLAETVNFNFDTSDFGLAIDPVLRGSVNGRAFTYTDTARVLLGREDHATALNETTPYQELGRIEVQLATSAMR